MNRRRLLQATAGFAVLGLSVPHRALADDDAALRAVRGALNASEFGVVPDAVEDQSAAFARLLERAGADDAPVFLPPGHYVLSDIVLPARVRLVGIAGATRLIHGGDGAFLRGWDSERLSLSGLVLDGAGAPLSADAKALLDLRGAGRIALADCTLVNSGGSGIWLERAAGRIARTQLSDIAGYGLYSLDARGLAIEDNALADCGDGGILVHRGAAGPDGTRVSRNRIAHIRADSGGTGQYGNGINAFGADDVAVSDNHIADCAFSAVRGNSAGNFSVTANTCLRSGETALYAEFAFQGAVFADNIVDGAANGISVANFNEGGRLCACSGNIVRNLSPHGPYPTPTTGFGIGISVEADTTVSGNVIEGAPLHGMRLGWGPFLRDVAASGNVVREAGVGIAVSVVEGSGAATISNNVIARSGKGAIVGYRWAEPVTGDLAETGAGDFPHLAVSDNQVS